MPCALGRVHRIASQVFRLVRDRACAIGDRVTGIFGGMMGSSERPAPPIEMRCDRPFMFLIRDEQTGAVLFMGRIADPSN